MPTLYVFKDADGNTHQFEGKSKSQAIKAKKRLNPFLVAKFVGTEKAPPRGKKKPSGPAESTEPQGRRRRAFGRNDRCPCDSGKKVKHCCVRTGSA